MTAMLRSTLAAAIGWADPTLRFKVQPPIKDRDWEPPLERAIFVVYAMGKTGPNADLLRRAANQILQGQRIEFDSPEDASEIAAEKPYLDCLDWYRKEQERKQAVRNKHELSLQPLVLTPEQQAAINSPDYDFPRLKKNSSRVVAMLSHVIPEIVHTHGSWGAIWSNSADTCHIMNSMVRHGILVVVEAVPDRSIMAAKVRSGPQYERALARFGIKPDWRATGTKKGVDYDYYNQVATGQIPPKFPHGV